MESGYDGIRAVFHGEPFNARCDQSRRLPRLLRKQDIDSKYNTAPGLHLSHAHALALDPFAQRSFCPVSILVLSSLSCDLRHSTWPPADPRNPPLYHRFMHACDLAPQADFLILDKPQNSSQRHQDQIRYMYIPSEYSSLHQSIDVTHDTRVLEQLDLPVGSH